MKKYRWQLAWTSAIFLTKEYWAWELGSLPDCAVRIKGPLCETLPGAKRSFRARLPHLNNITPADVQGLED